LGVRLHKEKRMNIVLDSNIIFDNWYLTGPNITVLQRHIKLGGSKLFIPEIVILEVKNLFKKRITQYAQSVKELNNLLSGLNKNVAFHDIDKMLELYDKALAKRLEALKAKTPTYNDIPQKNVASRALSQRKPFAESGKGYKDTLIWETILQRIADPKDKTFFITKNHKDFASEKHTKKLHPHLLDDLSANQLPADSVCLYPDIKSFVVDNILPYLKQIADDAVKELETGKYKSFSLKKWFIKNRDNIISSANKHIETLLSEPELENPSIAYIEDPEELSVDNLRLTDANTVYIDATVTADSVIDVFIFKSSYGFVSDEYPVEIQEYDWNEHYMWGQLILQLPISLSIIFDIENRKVREFEVNPFSGIYGFCPHCGAPIISDAAETCGKCGKSLLYSGNPD
jgi:rRNA-processing protein FCF1